MTIEPWDPFRDMVSLRDAVNSLVQESFVPPNGRTAKRSRHVYTSPGHYRGRGRFRGYGIDAWH